MKSQDIVVLLKLISLHQRWFNEHSYDLELLHVRDNTQDWFGNQIDIAEEPPLAFRESLFSMRALEQGTGVSKSQINLSLKRMVDVGLAKNDRKSGLPRTNVKGLLEFIAYGIRYVFPAKEGEVTRGVATSIAAPVLQGKLMTSGELMPVWAYSEGNVKGLAVEPLHPNIFQTIKTDGFMYGLLALTDAVRLGNPRERNIALGIMEKLLKVHL